MHSEIKQLSDFTIEFLETLLNHNLDYIRNNFLYLSTYLMETVNEITINDPASSSIRIKNTIKRVIDEFVHDVESFYKDIESAFGEEIAQRLANDMSPYIAMLVKERLIAMECQ